MENNTDITPVDELYQRAMIFAKNKKHRGGGISNLYVIQKTDMDGNVTGEYYGMNMMTDYGMSQYFGSSSPSFPTNIYIGNGTGSFNHTTNTLISPVITTASTSSNTTISYNYPLYYDSNSGLITCVCKFLEAYFDYNISGITDSITVTEYGLGTAYNALWTHSWVYDVSGAQTYITKEVNEKLSITVFLCMSYYESLIQSGWSEGRYTIITSMQRFINSSIRMYENSIYTYKRYNTGVTRSKSNTRSAFMNNEVTTTTNLSSFTMYDGTDSASGYIDGFCQWTSGFMTLEPQQLDDAESFETNLCMDWDHHYSTGLSDKFGDANGIPITQANITSVALYDHKTKAYDNTEQFTNDVNHWYCETSMATLFSTPIYYTNNNTIQLMYVFQNVRTDDPIVKFKNTGISTIYATDKYWDSSTWVRVTNLEEVPSELQNKRYWITNSNTVSMEPVRQSGEFKLIPTNGDNQTYSWMTSMNGIYPCCDNYEYGWFMVNGSVYVPDKSIAFNVGTTGSTSSASMTYGKWLLTFTSSTSYLSTDMSDVKTTGTIPTSVSITPLFTSSTNCLTNCYRSKSDTGIVCLQSLSASEATVIDLRGDTVNQMIFNSKLSVAVWGNNQVAYIPSDDTSKIRVYDFDVNGDIKEFTIPSDVTTVSLMIAHRDFIWITDGSMYTYVMDIRDGSITGCTNTIPLNSNLNTIEMTAVDDVMIFHRWTDLTASSAYYVRYDNPTVPGDLSKLDTSLSYLNSRSHYDLRYVHGNTLVLLITTGRRYSSTGAYNYIVDFGKFLDDDTISYTYKSADSWTSFIPYGEFFIVGNTRIPIEYFLYHKIIGTTKTITTINYIKNISGKQWNTTITNIPEFNGLPPGNVQ